LPLREKIKNYLNSQSSFARLLEGQPEAEVFLVTARSFISFSKRQIGVTSYEQ